VTLRPMNNAKSYVKPYPRHRIMPLPKRPRDPNQLAKSIIDIATGQKPDRDPTPEEQGKDPAAVTMGKKGGTARAAGMTAKATQRDRQESCGKTLG
jgi:hypothetical protein